MIVAARGQKAFVRKYTKFDPVDFLVEELYNSKNDRREKPTALEAQKPSHFRPDFEQNR